MAVQPTRRRFTVAEYYRLAEIGVLSQDERIELVDGEIIEMSPVGGRHAACVDRLARLFMRGVGDVAIVRVQNPIRLGDYTEPRPDLTLLRPQADFYATDHPTQEAVLLVVEVADSSVEFDRQVKAPLYARSGIPELWLVGVGPDDVVVYRDPTSAGYRTTRALRRGDTISPVAFPDLEIGVAEILG